MIVVRFKVQIKPEKIDEALVAFASVIPPSQVLDGVLHFDGGRDLTNPNALIFTEVYADRDAMARQEALPETGTAMANFEDFLAGEPEATVFEVSSSRPWAPVLSET